MSTVTTSKDQTSTVGTRIRAERLRLGLSQEAFSKRVGVHRRTQVNYESGAREPDTSYLEAASRIGADVGYVLTGVVTDQWHQSLKHLVDVMLDLLHLTKHEAEFNALWQIAYDERMAMWRGESIKDKADRALWELLRKSPLMLESTPLADVIERLEFVLDTRSIVLTPQSKADAILRLYKVAKSQGGSPDLQAVAAIVESCR